LINWLDKGIQHKITLISAPAGYGKSTLLSEWANKTQVPVAWLSLDESDNIRPRFWKYFRAALHTLPTIQETEIGDALLSSLQSPTPPPVEEIFISLINDFVQLQETVALVLDDLQVITNSQIHTDLIFLLDHLPSVKKGLHILVASRTNPPWPLARLRVRDDLLELRENDLRFLESEAAQFLNTVMGLKLSSKDIGVLEDKTEGWIAGLQMAAISLQKRLKSDGELGVSGYIDGFTGGHQFVIDYLVEEVLNQQSPEIQGFLLRTSILERMNAALCDAVLNRDNSQFTLGKLDQDNLFLIPLDENRNWYRYHHLFAELLRGRMETSTPELALDLHLRASVWFADHDFLDEAIRHALAAEDYGRAARLIEEHGMQMIDKGELVTLKRWLEFIPEEYLIVHPWLCIYDAWTRYYIGPRDSVEERLQDAELQLEALQRESPPDQLASLTDSEFQHLRGHIAALRAYLDLQKENFDAVVEFAHQALDYLPEGDYARATSAIALAETFRASGDLAGWYRAYDRARSIALECDNLPMAVSSTTYMADQLAKGGQLPAAHDAYQEAIELAAVNGKFIPAVGLPYVKLGDLLREWNQLENASSYLEKGIKSCQEWGHSDSLVIGYVALSRLQLTEGDFLSAQDTFRKAEQLVRKTAIDPWTVSMTDDCRLRLWIAKGELSAIGHWVAESGLGVSDQLNFHRDLEHLNLTRALMAQGIHDPDGPQLKEGLHLLERIQEFAEQAGWVGKLITCLNLQALAYYALNREAKAQEVLARAMRFARPGGYMRIFLDEGQPMAQLLYQALANSVEQEYASKLLGAFDESASEHLMSEAIPSQDIVEPLTKREIEVLRLIDQGMTNGEIGMELSISLGTVKRHTANINGKMGVHTRTQAAAKARTLGIL